MRVRHKYIAMAIIFCGLLGGPASAISEYNKAIAHVGAQSSNGYVTFTVPPAGSCSFGNIYLNLTTDSGKAYYALLMTAYMGGRPVSRVDYTNTAGTCTIDLVEM
jgi:hypothetical protein